MVFMLAVNFSFLLQLADSHSHRGQHALDMTLHTLRMMAHGGIHDHVGQVRIDCFIALYVMMDNNVHGPFRQWQSLNYYMLSVVFL